MQGLMYAVGVAAALLLIGTVALAQLQDRLLLYPPATGLAAEASPVGARLVDAQGDFVGWAREPTVAPAKATLLVFHGNAGCAHHHGPLAEALAQRGWRVLSIEYPGFCGRAGAASVDSIVADARARADEARSRWPGPLAVAGYSFGAAIAASIAARDDAVAGALLITPWASFRGLAAHHYPFLPVRLAARRDLETVDTLERVVERGAAVVVVGAVEDTIVPVGHAREIAQRHPSARYIELADAGHADWIEGPAGLRAEHWDAIDAMLAGPGGGGHAGSGPGPGRGSGGTGPGVGTDGRGGR